MKKIFLVVFVCFTSSLIAQQTLWLDVYKNTSSKEEAVYYRLAPQKKDNGFWIVDYYKSGRKQMEGFSFSNKLGSEKWNDLVTYYYENGNIYQEKHYENGKLSGKFTEYYETGEVKIIGKYENGKEADVWKTFSKTGKIFTKGKYNNGEKVGVWKTFYKNES